MMQELPAIEDLLETAGDAPIIRMAQRAADPGRARRRQRHPHRAPRAPPPACAFRVDGTLREVVQPNRAARRADQPARRSWPSLDIAEKRLPQDGRISLRLGTRAIDVRVSTLPSAHGERAVLRLLDKSESKLSLEAVGMQGQTLARLEHLDQPAARHHPGHRPDRLGQDHHALCRAAAARRGPPNIIDGRGPDRVRAARRRPDPGQRQDQS